MAETYTSSVVDPISMPLGEVEVLVAASNVHLEMSLTQQMRARHQPTLNSSGVYSFHIYVLSFLRFIFWNVYVPVSKNANGP